MSDRPPKPRWRLATQLAGVLAASVLVCAAIIVTETQLFAKYELQRVLGELTPPAKRAVVALQAHRKPATGDLIELVEVQARINADAEVRSDIALLIFTLTAAFGAFCAGLLMLRRLGRGLVDVADTARAVAGGDLTARAQPVRRASREEAQLTQDFNAMAQALATADRELKDSTAAIAHELRTPLTILSGRLHGIQDGVFDTGPAQIGSLIHQVDALTRLVEDLQTTSLANFGQLVLDVQAIELAEVARPAIEAIRPDLAAAGVSLELALTPAHLMGDARRLRQAISAVLANVERYAADSGVVRIETAAGPDRVCLRVIDRGPGMSDEEMARAFDRFWRADASRARVRGGSGLGLSVVRAIADAHQGSVSLSRRPGGGTIFEIILPVTQRDLDQNSTKA